MGPMQRVRVKICGVRAPAEALKIAQMGADAIGLVFAASPRWVSPEDAKAVTEALPPMVWPVGVFVDADAETINRVAGRTGIAVAQLHGHETPDLVEQLSIPAVKAFPVAGPEWIDHVRAWLDALPARRKLAAILLDAHSATARGGTGRRFNWEWVAEARADGKLAGLPPMILSGGLDAGNVAVAIETVGPWAVDVSSGVESAPGVKDLRKVEDFIRATREGDELHSEFWL